MSALQFDKIEGTGNDFIVVTAADASGVEWSSLATRVCDRHHGVGADGVLVVGPSEGADLRMRLFNADGSEAEMCGNGIRCAALFALDRGLTKNQSVQWETGAGLVRTDVLEISGREATVRVNMGMPRLRPVDIPVDAEDDSAPVVVVNVGTRTLELVCVGMGNPHAVTFVDSVDTFPLAEVGPQVERHSLFPRRTNFEVVEVVDRGHLRMRVWERGVGETMACGTGACAAAVAARLRRGVASDLEVRLPGGVVGLRWEDGGPVILTGAARTVFSGSFELEPEVAAGTLARLA